MDERLIAEYVDACGVSALRLVPCDKGYNANIIDFRDASSNTSTPVFWFSKSVALRIARAARRNLAEVNSLEAARNIILRLAIKMNVTPTKHETMVERARQLSLALMSQLEKMRNDGGLREFNSAYRAKREAALKQGTGFMSYPVAMKRLRKAIIGRLMYGSGMPMKKSLFEEVFEDADTQHGSG